MTDAQPARQSRRRAFYRWGSLGALALMAAIVLGERTLAIDLTWPAILVLAAALAMAVGMFNALDEMAKQAHYIAWYWGGVIALSAIAFVVVALQLDLVSWPAITAWLPRLAFADGPDAFVAGLMTTPALMLIGFGGWWGVYWLRRR